MITDECSAGVSSEASGRLQASEPSANAPCPHYPKLLHNVQNDSSLWTIESQDHGTRLRHAAIAGLDAAQFKQVLKAVCASAKGNSRQLLNVLNAQDEHGATPLHCAAYSSKPKAIKALMKAGAEPNIKDEDGNTPLHLVLIGSSVEISVMHQCLQELLTVQTAGGRKSLADTFNKAGFTPLMYAIQHDNAEAAELLVKSGADFTAKCRAKEGNGAGSDTLIGLTPLQMAVNYDRQLVLDRLLHCLMKQHEEEEQGNQEEPQQQTRSKKGRKTARMQVLEEDVVEAVKHMMPIWKQHGTATDKQLLQHYTKRYPLLENITATAEEGVQDPEAGDGDCEAAVAVAEASGATGTDADGTSKTASKDQQQQQQQGVVLTQLAQQLKQMKRSRETNVAANAQHTNEQQVEDTQRNKRLCITPSADQTSKQTSQQQQPGDLSPLSPAGLQPIAAAATDSAAAAAAAAVNGPAGVTPGAGSKVVTPGPGTVGLVTGGPGESQKTPPGITPGPSGTQKTPGSNSGVATLLLSPRAPAATPLSGPKGPSPVTASKRTAAAQGSSRNRQSARLAAAMGSSSSKDQRPAAAADGSAAAAASGGANSGASGMRLSRQAARLLGATATAATGNKQQEQRQKSDRLQLIAPVLIPTAAAYIAEEGDPVGQPVAVAAATTAEQAEAAGVEALQVADKENEAPAAGNLAGDMLEKPQVASLVTTAACQEVTPYEAAMLASTSMTDSVRPAVESVPENELAPAIESDDQIMEDQPAAAAAAELATQPVEPQAAAVVAAGEPSEDIIAVQSAAQEDTAAAAVAVPAPAGVGGAAIAARQPAEGTLAEQLAAQEVPAAVSIAVPAPAEAESAAADSRDALVRSDAVLQEEEEQEVAEEPREKKEQEVDISTQQLLQPTQQQQQQPDDEMEVDRDEPHQDEAQQQQQQGGDNGDVQQTQPVGPHVATQQQQLNEQQTEVSVTGAMAVARVGTLSSHQGTAVQIARLTLAQRQQQNTPLPTQQHFGTRAEPSTHTQQQQQEGRIFNELSADAEFQFAGLQHKAIKLLLAKHEVQEYGRELQPTAAKRLLDLSTRMMNHLSRALPSYVHEADVCAEQQREQRQQQNWAAIQAQINTVLTVLNQQVANGCSVDKLMGMCSSAAVVAEHLHTEAEQLFDEYTVMEDNDEYLSCRNAWRAATELQAKLLNTMLQQQQQQPDTIQVYAVLKPALVFVRQAVTEKDRDFAGTAFTIGICALSSYYAAAAAGSCSYSSGYGGYGYDASTVGKTAIIWLQMLVYVGEVIQLVRTGDSDYHVGGDSSSSNAVLMNNRLSIDDLRAAVGVVGKYKEVHQQNSDEIQWALDTAIVEADNTGRSSSYGDCDSRESVEEFDEKVELGLLHVTKLLMQQQQQGVAGSSSSSAAPAVKDLSGLVSVVGSVLHVCDSSSDECQDLQLEIVEMMNDLRDGLVA